MELNREQVIKALECLLSTDDREFCEAKGCLFADCDSCVEDVLIASLALIKEQEDQIFKLENRLKECENGYEGTLFLDRCKLHDAEEKVKQLTEENERLSGKVTEYEEERKYHFEMSRKRIAEAKADTVRKMQERLDKHFCHDPAFLGVEQRLIMGAIDQIAKEMVEDLNRDI